MIRRLCLTLFWVVVACIYVGGTLFVLWLFGADFHRRGFGLGLGIVLSFVWLCCVASSARDDFRRNFPVSPRKEGGKAEEEKP